MELADTADLKSAAEKRTGSSPVSATKLKKIKRNEYAKKLRKEGLTYKQIAERISVSYNTVRYILADGNQKERMKSKWKKDKDPNRKLKPSQKCLIPECEKRKLPGSNEIFCRKCKAEEHRKTQEWVKTGIYDTSAWLQ